MWKVRIMSIWRMKGRGTMEVAQMPGWAVWIVGSLGA